MIKCKPERNPKQAIILVSLCAVTALICGFLCVKVDTLKWLTQLLFISAVAVGIFAVSRYTLTEMIYTVGDGSFTVTKVTGSKQTVACSLNTSTAIGLYTKSEYRAAITAKELQSPFKYYNFNQNYRPSGSYVYVSEFNGKVLAVEFEPNAIFAAAFLDEIDRNKKD